VNHWTSLAGAACIAWKQIIHPTVERKHYSALQEHHKDASTKVQNPAATPNEDQRKLVHCVWSLPLVFWKKRSKSTRCCQEFIKTLR